MPLPGAKPVNRPLVAFIVPTVELENCHVIVAPVMAILLPSRTAPLNWSVWLATTLAG
jgi:hypothetical protein